MVYTHVHTLREVWFELGDGYRLDQVPVDSQQSRCDKYRFPATVSCQVYWHDVGRDKIKKYLC